MRVPGLHVVTDDEVLADPRFTARARRLVEAHGDAIALHLRGPRTPPARLLRLGVDLRSATTEAGALLLVNGRADVALAAAADGVHLGQRSLPVAAARSLRHDWLVGASVHDPDGLTDEAGEAAADFLLVGTIWTTPSHPGRPGAGVERVAEVARRVAVPVVAIGGVTPERVASAVSAGAAGVAVLRGVWDSPDVVGAAAEYLRALDRTLDEQWDTI